MESDQSCITVLTTTERVICQKVIRQSSQTLTQWAGHTLSRHLKSFSSLVLHLPKTGWDFCVSVRTSHFSCVPSPSLPSLYKLMSGHAISSDVWFIAMDCRGVRELQCLTTQCDNRLPCCVCAIVCVTCVPFSVILLHIMTLTSLNAAHESCVTIRKTCQWS